MQADKWRSGTGNLLSRNPQEFSSECLDSLETMTRNQAQAWLCQARHGYVCQSSVYYTKCERTTIKQYGNA